MAPKIYHGISEIENTVSQLPHIVAHETNLTNQNIYIHIYKQRKKNHQNKKNQPHTYFYLWGTAKPCPSQLCREVGAQTLTRFSRVLSRRTTAPFQGEEVCTLLSCLCDAFTRPDPPQVLPQQHFSWKEPSFQAAWCSIIASHGSVCLLSYDITLRKQRNKCGSGTGFGEYRWLKAGVFRRIPCLATKLKNQGGCLSV